MRELIYKNEAYKAIDNCIRDSWDRISPADAKMNIRHLVSDANEVDRPQGEWNPHYTEREYNDIFNCKLCSCTFIVIQGKDNMNYCPNCGCRMKGADNDRRGI